jgi:4-amino-4-deoxy-L-arabinose transferase-like glycosyltransferase
MMCLGFLAPYQFFGDCPVHAWISKRIWDSGAIVSSFDFVVDPNGTQLPINYPLLFHTALALSNTASSNHALNFQVFAFAFSVAFALAFYTFLRFILGRKYAFISLVVLLGSSQMFTLSIVVFMELFLFAFVLLGIFSIFKFLKFHDARFLYLSAFLLGASIATKQSVLLILIPLALWLILLKRNDLRKLIRLRRILISLFLMILVASPFLYYQISATGTLTYPPEGPIIGFISQKIFHLIPRVAEDPRASQYIIASMEQENRVSWLLADSRRVNRLFYPFSLNGLSVTYVLFFIFLFMGAFCSISNNKDFLILYLLLVATSIPFIITESGNPRYHLLVFLFTIPFVCLGAEKAKNIHKILSFLFIFFIVFSSVATFYDNAVHIESISRAYMETGYFSPDYRDYSIQAYEKLKVLQPTGLVLSGQWPETMLYGNVTVTWISPFGGAEYIDLFSTTDFNVIESVIEKCKIQYVVINRMDKHQTWYGPLRDYEFYDLLERGLYGRMIYNNTWVSIYDVRA